MKKELKMSSFFALFGVFYREKCIKSTNTYHHIKREY